LVASGSSGADIEYLEVARDNGRIVVHSSLLLDAPSEFVFQVLSDYDRFASLSSRFKESRYLDPSASGSPQIYTELEGCVWFFCRTVKRQAQLKLEPHSRIVATAMPEHSDVDYGVEVWELSDVEGQTRIVYHHDMDPKFWVPPVVGVWAIRRALKSDSLSAAAKLEQLALEEQLEQQSLDQKTLLNDDEEIELDQQ
jgi:hypothetical protein